MNGSNGDGTVNARTSTCGESSYSTREIVNNEARRDAYREGGGNNFAEDYEF